MKQIRIEIAPDGKIKAETLGMHGKECLKYVTLLEQMTNAVCDDSVFTKDYYTAAADNTAETAQEEEVRS